MEKEKKEFDSGVNMTTGSVPKLLIKFALPTMGQQVVLVIQSLILTFLAGRYIGPVALGAMAVTMPIVMIINSIAMGLTTANSILIAQAYGRRNLEEIRKIIDTSMILVYGVCLFMIVFGLLFARGILVLIQTPKEIFDAANTIFTIVLCGIPFVFTQFLFFNSLRGLGDSTRPMWFQIVKLVLNITLLPLLITGIFGMPKLGVAGLGLTMTGADFIMAIIVWAYLRITNSIIAPRFKSIKFIPEIAKLTFSIGFPSMIQQVLLNASVLFVVSLVNGFGHYATEGYGVGTRIDFVAFALSISICSSVSIISGQNLGVEKYDRVKETCKYGLIFAILFSAPAFIAALCFSEPLMRIFVTDPNVVAVGAQYLRFIGFNYVMLNVMFTFEGIPIAAGQTYVATIVTLINVFICRLPIAYFLSKTSLGIKGIWVAILISTFIGISIMVAYFFSGKWKVKNLIENN